MRNRQVHFKPCCTKRSVKPVASKHFNSTIGQSSGRVPDLKPSVDEVKLVFKTSSGLKFSGLAVSVDLAAKIKQPR